MSVLLVLDDVDHLPGSLGVNARGGTAHLLSFNPDQRVTDEALDRLRHQALEVYDVSAADQLDRVASRARRSFSRLVADLPVGPHVGGRTLKDAFVFDGRLSMWWLNDLSSKRNDIYPTFNQLCKLEAIRDAVSACTPDSMVLLTDDGDFWDVIEGYCGQHVVDFGATRPKGGIGSSAARRMLLRRRFGGLLRWFARTGVQTLVAKTLILFGVLKAHAGRGACAFYSHYPGQWRVTGGRLDEKYSTTPNVLQRRHGTPTFYACTFASDGLHNSAPMLQFYRSLKWLRLRQRDPSRVPVHLIDADLTTWSFLRALLGISIYWKYLRLERNADFTGAWRYDGIDVWPLIRREFRTAMPRIPRYILHSLRVRNFVDKFSPACWVSYGFEFPYGRSAIYGVKTARRAVPFVGVAHGPILDRRLRYHHCPGEIRPSPERPLDFVANMPIPDVVIVEGQAGKECLVDSGFPADRVHVGGAPRLGELMNMPTESNPSADGPLKVLVAFGKDDEFPTLSVCRPVMERRTDCHFTLKLNPRRGLAIEDFKARIDCQATAASYEIPVQDSIYELLAESDAVVVTYSGFGIEAAVSGYPVICLHLPDRVTESVLLDVEADNVVWVSDEREFDDALNRALGKRGEPRMRNRDLERHCFDVLDGTASEKWASIIRTVTAGS